MDKMDKEVLITDKAPKSVGPYSQMVKCGDFLFISGQISADVKTGEIVHQDVTKQTHTIMRTIKDMLDDAGSNMDKVVKCSVHLSDAIYFEEMNNVYLQYFDNGYPARITVSGVQLYDGVNVEIDVIAAV
ncbi:hypothetical protein EXM22_17125 [Oceanispirochaeta crateris]|uniref:RidA family protein n=1 Tax=Oceanispirochaeta crateris TaxID=2518645 RepID=A0A5C1QPQ2_9SPIO|nr:Rid family detoxifying hydrolase [Oceanispirochaeta crateris]QEN09621.1 hypothetical protein EXM22_17125 [Oceanispirochaeta crateris]